MPQYPTPNPELVSPLPSQYTRGMGYQPSESEILSAVEGSGYLMEQDVATELESLSFYVHTGWAFKDCDEGKSRELDVHAFRRVAGSTGKLTVDVVLLCECKNNRNPFVFISRRKSVVGTCGGNVAPV